MYIRYVPAAGATQAHSAYTIRWTKPPYGGSFSDFVIWSVSSNFKYHEKKEKLSQRFVRELTFRNYSTRTISAYLSVLVQLSRHFGKSPEEISSEELKEYLYGAKHRRGLSNSFINQTISAVKILYQDVLNQKWDDQIKIKRPRKELPMPEILSKDEVVQMIEATSNFKHKSIIALLYSSGIRREELLHLQLKDIDSKRMVVRITLGKGNRSRDVLLAENTLKLLRKYYQTFHPNLLSMFLRPEQSRESRIQLLLSDIS